MTPGARRAYRARRAACLARLEAEARQVAAEAARDGGGPADLVAAMRGRGVALADAWAADLVEAAT